MIQSLSHYVRFLLQIGGERLSEIFRVEIRWVLASYPGPTPMWGWVGSGAWIRWLGRFSDYISLTDVDQSVVTVYLLCPLQYGSARGVPYSAEQGEQWQTVLFNYHVHKYKYSHQNTCSLVFSP